MSRMVVLCLIILHRLAVSQTFQNIHAQMEGGNVIIHYDLAGTAKGVKVNVRVYSSHNNFTAPLSKVHGDIQNVIPGKDKRVVWNATEEIKTFSGKISFELRGDLVYEWMFLNPRESTSMRRGKEATIKWQGGAPTDKFKLELMQGKDLQVLHEGTNTGTFAWKIPKKQVKGTGYVLKLSSGTTSIESGPIKIKRKTPLVVWASPAVLVGAGLYFLLKPGPEPLPGPPDQGN